MVAGLLAALVATWSIAALASVSLGAMPIPLAALWEVMATPPFAVRDLTNGPEWAVVWNLRIPRLLLATVVGAALGMAGVAMQGVFRNPLAEPGLIGVSSGAALGAVLSIALGISALPVLGGVGSATAIALCAFVGALCSTTLVVLLATQRGRTSVVGMLLTGIAINAGAGAVLGAVSYAATDTQLRNITLWTLGSLAGATWPAIAICCGVTCLAALLYWRDRNALDLLQLGEAEAFHSGIAVNPLKLRVVITTAATVGCAVAFTGLIGFVGLVVPHVVRMCVGGLHRHTLPASALLGAALLVCADLIARTLVAPSELPIGVVTASIGTPFFVALVYRSQRRLEGF